MNQEQIDRQLLSLSRIERPPAPDLRRKVRKEIARRRSRTSFRHRIQALFNWNDLLLRPGIAAGALVIALAIGSLPGALSFFRTYPKSEVVYARSSLHLDVFSPVGLLPTSTGFPSH